MWPGGLKSVEKGKMLEENPTRVIEKAVWGMVPKTKLGKQVFSKLKVYSGTEHPHGAQNPEPLNVKKG
jgi:large subunit ribosomal protein L13